jgi:hypothetical protein
VLCGAFLDRGETLIPDLSRKVQRLSKKVQQEGCPTIFGICQGVSVGGSCVKARKACSHEAAARPAPSREGARPRRDTSAGVSATAPASNGCSTHDDDLLLQALGGVVPRRAGCEESLDRAHVGCRKDREEQTGNARRDRVKMKNEGRRRSRRGRTKERSGGVKRRREAHSSALAHALAYDRVGHQLHPDALINLGCDCDGLRPPAAPVSPSR